MNFVDFIIVLILIFYAIEGVSAGFINSLLDLISFIVSFATGLFFYSFFGKLLIKNFSVPIGFSNAIGFFIVAFLSEIILSYVLRSFSKSLAFSVRKSGLTRAMDSFLGGLCAVLSGVILVSFLLTMAITLPLSPFVKQSISSSKISKVLTANTQGLSKLINNVFGGAVNETLTFLTVEPKGNESVPLNFQTGNFKIDYGAETAMFNDVNKERTSRGIGPLVVGSQTLIDVGRAHCEDMFKRGYFSHYTPEGLSPFDRMSQTGITFNYAGENLALAPDEQLAMQGLMQSPGHRENILNPNYGRIGIGVIDGGIYGEMFCQEFTD